MTVRQPDGTIIHCLATGDEFHNWLHDENDYTIMQDHATGYYVFATLKLGQLRPTSFLPGRDDPARAGLMPGVNISSDQWAQKRASILSGTPLDIGIAPTTGTINNIVIFVRFSDDEEFTGSPAVYSDMFNASGQGVSSLYNYFREVSYGALEVFSTFYPASTGATVLSYQDSEPRAYYVPYSATNTLGYTNEQCSTRLRTLLARAVGAVAAQVPNNLTIDADNNGYVDNVCFIVKGSPTAWATLLWPHTGWLGSSGLELAGKTIAVYNLQIESMMRVSVLCHEMMHTLGAPDLYHYHAGLDPVGVWDIMASPVDPPQHPATFLKYGYLKWISSIPEITTSGQYSLRPTSSASNNCYRIASPNSAREYFVLEYRRKSGTFDRTLPGEGLIVYRINPVTMGNASGPPDEVYIYRPNGTSASNGDLSQANFSFETGRTIFSDSTNPRPFLADGGEGGLSLSGIGNAVSTISFKYQKPGIATITSDNIVLGQQGTLTVTVVSPQSAEYEVEVRDENGTAAPPWTWNTTVTPPVQVSAGRRQVFTFLVEPTYSSETFQISLLKRNVGGAWGTFATQQVTLSATGGGKASIVIATANAEGWSDPSDGATVNLFDSAGAQIASAKTNSSGVAGFADIPSGAEYSYNVVCQSLLFGDQYWGSKGGVSTVANTTTYISFVRNAPYAPLINVYDDSTNAEVTGDSVLAGTKIRVELTVKNPNNPGAISASSRARLIVDRYKSPPYDFEDISSYQSYDVGQIRKISFTVKPTIEGQYYYAEEVFSEIGGIETKTDGSYWGYLLWVQGKGPGTGDLSITVSNAEGWGDFGSGAVVELYDAAGALIATQTTDASSMVMFSGIPSTTMYCYKVAVPAVSGTPWTTYHYWGTKSGIAVTAGETTMDYFTRNAPYAPEITAYNNATNVVLENGTVFTGTTIRVELAIKNPTYEGATAQMAAGRVILDRDRSSGYDFDQTAENQSYAIGESRNVPFYYTPSDTGTYYYTECVIGLEALTDGSGWGRPLFTAVLGDVVAPGVPANIAATPSGWQNSSSFSLDWTSPTDPSGIAAAWYKVGSAPATSADGIRSTSKPMPVAATAEGGQPVYVWLEDGVGNKDHTARGMTTMYYDATAPTGGTIAVNSGAATTSSLAVTLNTLGATDAGGSGVSHMRLSNDNSTWSTWEVLASTRTGWNLSLYGGTSNEGMKTVHVQYRDNAGNTSVSYSDGITYQGADLSAPGVPASMTATPSSWTNVNQFSINWVNPSDPSGIAAAWYKQGMAPTSSTDGIRKTEKPLVVPATAQGGQQLHLWLEDGSSNKDHANKATVQLFFDETPPSEGTISINSGAMTTSSPIVSLNGLGASDAGGSGVFQMRFSNDTFAWSSWADYAVSKSGWDLTADGGGTAGGEKRVYAQYRDAAGNASVAANDKIVYVTTSVELWGTGVPDQFALHQNFPNPFNPTTVIRLDIPVITEVSLIVVNMLGQEVAVLASGQMQPGSYGLQFDAGDLPSGIYLYRLRAGDFVETRRLVLLR